MLLTKKFNTIILSGLLACAALTGCAKKIGAPDSPSDLKGVTTTETLEGSNFQVRRVHLDGSHLHEGTSYKFKNLSLTIDGSVPDGVTIDGDGGQLVITGNTGKKVTLNVSVPEYTHQESYTYFQPIYSTDGKGNMTLIGMMPMTGYTTIDDGPRPPFDTTPAVVIKGHTGNGLDINMSKGAQFSPK